MKRNTNDEWELWHTYHEDIVSRENMPPALKEAWERADKKNIDPYQSRLPHVSDEVKQSVKRKYKQLFVYCQSISTALIARAVRRNADYCALLFSKEGILIRFYGTEKMTTWFEQRGIEAWTDWSEDKIGPNPFSMGMKAGDSIKLSGPQNYLQVFLGAEWLFMPITVAGEVEGGLALVSSSGRVGDAKENLLISLCKNIEMHFFWFNTLQQCMDATDGMGFVAFDLSVHQDRILVMSKQAFKILRLPVADFFYLPVETYIDPLPKNPEFWSILKEKKSVSDYNLQLSCQGKKTSVCISTSPYRQEGLHIDGMVMLMNSINRMQKLASRFSTGTAKFTFDTIIGNSRRFQDVLALSRNAAAHEGNILLLGESGSGKDVLAQAIHNGSLRSGGPFVALNCAALSKELIASELFGYEEGAFTGAKKGGSIGKLELANNGTLFLDEIGDMPMELQAVLLRVIEEQSFMRLGGNKVVKVNVRIIAATNQNLKRRITENKFRSDLFYRLSVVRINIPPLRERRDDILLLADYFIGNICARYGRRKLTLTPEAESYLVHYSWPGNVRELQNVLDGIVCTCTGTEVGIDILRAYLGEEKEQEPLITDTIINIRDERREMLEALSQCRGNRAKAAKMMNMSRSTFYRRMKEYGIDVPKHGI